MRATASTVVVIIAATVAAVAAHAAKPAPAPPVVIGPAVNCLQLQNIRQTQVRDDKTIDFITRDGRWFRNTLPNRCAQLGFERAFAYQTSITQLCNVDIITVIVQGAGARRGASCGLGKFTPIEPITKAKA